MYDVPTCPGSCVERRVKLPHFCLPACPHPGGRLSSTDPCSCVAHPSPPTMAAQKSGINWTTYCFTLRAGLVEWKSGEQERGASFRPHCP